MPDTANPPEIDVGEAGPTFRNWLVAEAKRQAELRLAAQAAAMTSIETRAAAVLSWSTAALLALVTLAAQHFSAFPPVLLAGACLAMAIVFCIYALSPRQRFLPGYDLTLLRSLKYDTELEVNESVASGYEDCLRSNDARIAHVARILRGAWFWFAFAPFCAAAGAAFFTR